MPKKQNLLGLTVKKEEDFPEWYHQVLTKAELISYHDISGCYVLRPNAFEIWEFIQQYLDKEFKKNGVRNAYFPLFISKKSLEKEKEHLDDFSPEVAWITKAGDKTLENEIAIRPTSETIMYEYFKDWLKSHRDLPMKYNQWCNVVRWEFKDPTPFIRSREFLWQEGHTAHMTEEEAEEQVMTSLDLYTKLYEEVLCVPVFPGQKTKKEKFAGADYTTTIEAFIPETGRGIQAGTSHMLGQNFAKMFNIQYEDPTELGKKNHVYQTSWGVTTRSIGTMIMTHADNIGMVLPPKVAFCQVIIVPTGMNKKTTEDVKEKLFQLCRDYEAVLNEAGIRCQCDLRETYSPPWKYNYWEMRGVPLRLEIGPREIEAGTATFVNRVTMEKTTNEVTVKNIQDILKHISTLLYENAQKKVVEATGSATNIDEMAKLVQSKKMVCAPFCGEIECENNLKEQMNKMEGCQGTKSLCVPHAQYVMLMVGLGSIDLKCVNPNCEIMCTDITMFGKSY